MVKGNNDYLTAIEELQKSLDTICNTKKMWLNDELVINVLTAYYHAIYNEVHNVLALDKRHPESEQKIREILAYNVIGAKPKQGKKAFLGAMQVIETKIMQIKSAKKVNSTMLISYNKLYDDYYALAAFRSLKHFATYMEWDLPPDKRIFNMTLNCFGGYWYYANQAILDNSWNKIFSQAPTGYGKCTPCATRVRTPNGIMAIGNLKVGDMVYSMRDNTLVKCLVKNKWETKKPQYKIATRGGVNIVVSPEHRLLTQRGYIEAQNLTKDDYLYRLCSEIDGGNFVDEFELMFVTLMMFDGHCSGNFTFTHKGGELFERFTQQLQKHGFTYREYSKSGSCREIGVHSNNGKTKTILEKYGLFNKLAKEKSIPQQFFTMPLKQKYEFLGYMFATDGYFERCTSSGGITLASEQLIRDLQEFCNSCAIYSRIDQRKVKLEGKVCNAWRLTIPAYYIQRIYKNCYCYDKQPLLEEIMQRIKEFDGGAYCNATNYPKDILLPCVEFKKKVNKSWARNKSFKQSCVEAFNNETHLLDNIVYKDFVWEQIKSIEYDPTIVDMVDIEVEDTHNFLANDLVSHNSYKDTVTIAFILGYEIDADILKVSGNPSVIATNTNRLVKYMTKPAYAKVFPYYAQFGCNKDKMFDTCQIGGNDKPSRLLVHGSDKGESLLFCNKQTPIDGSRYKYKFYDDITKSKDKNNIAMHEKDVETYTSEWERRKYDDFHNVEFFSGTAYHNEDFLCTIKRRNGADNAEKSKINKYTYYNNKYRAVFVKVPKLDYDTDEITFPQMYSEEAAKRKRDEDPREFYSMDQQEPMPIEGCPFDYPNLRTYTSIPYKENGEPEDYYAVLDPARTGANFVAMPICVKIDGVFYLKDVIFEMRNMEELHNEIVEKILRYKIVQFHIEKNTDTSLKKLISKMVEERGYYSCNFSEVYSVKNKEEKIQNAEAAIRNNIVFPAFNLYGQSRQMRNFMKYFTSYSYLTKNKYDDAPDSMAMFANKFVRTDSRNRKATTIQL